MLKDLFFTVDHSINWKNTEIPITISAVRYRRYPATRHSPEEPAFWEISSFELPEGWDHLEAFVWDQLEEDEEFIFEQLDDRLSSWLDSHYGSGLFK